MAKTTSKTDSDFIDYKKLPHSSIRELAYKIKQVDDVLDNPDTPESRSDRRPRFTFFLGAGASFQSGIKLAGQMMQDFKKRIFERECQKLKTDEEKDAWLKKQDWFSEGEKEYSCLFERYDDDKLARQRYIESTIKKGSPSFGYLMMAYLLVNNYANTILTTNFDDLAYTSCVTFTGIRPLIYAYGTLASEMRLSSVRPKIFKLHGDYLYSALINTDNEMEEMMAVFNLPEQFPTLAQKIKDISMLDFNMGDDIVRILSEYGLIVVGYEGNDESIRNIFRKIPYNRELFWCYWKPKPPNQEVLKLLQEKNGRLVTIDGFDELMSEIESVIKLKEDKLIADIDAQKDKILQLITKYRPEFTKDFVSDVVKKPEKEKKISKSDLTDIVYQALNAKNNFQYEKAAKLYEQAFEIAEKTLGKENPDYATRLNNLAGVYRDQGRYDEAIEKYEEALRIGEETIGKEHPDYATFLNNLAIVYRDQGRYDEAIEKYEEALRIGEETIGKEHPDYATRLNNLADVYREQGRYDEAIEKHEEALRIGEETIGKEHPAYATFLNNLANVYRDQGRYDEAIELYKQALEIYENTLGKEHPFYAYVLSNLAKTHNSQNKYDEAIELSQRAIKIDVKTIGKKHPRYAIHLNTLAEVYLNQEKYNEALPLFEEALRILEKTLPAKHKNTAMVGDNLKNCQEAMKEK